MRVMEAVRLQRLLAGFHRDMVQRKEVLVQYLPTDEQVVDVLTKPLTRTKFEYFRDRLGMVENASLAEREC
jgi:hypothetical protein